MITTLIILLTISVITLGVVFKKHNFLRDEYESIQKEHDELKNKYNLGKSTRELLRKEIHELRNQQPPIPTMKPAREKRTKKA